MSDAGKQLSPNEELAVTITDALIAEGLILERKKPELLSKLSAGSVREVDWHQWIEEAIDVTSRDQAKTD